MKICTGCDQRDEQLKDRAERIAYLKLIRLAYRAALREVCPDQDMRIKILTRHMERLGV